MRRAAGIIILRLPLNMSVMIDPPHIWNVIHNAGGSKNKKRPTWLDFAPAIQKKIVSSDPSFPMHRVAGIILAPHQILCVCHARWMAWLTLLTYETSFKMRRETRINPNLIKYCACHATLQSQILQNFTGNSWSDISNVRPIGAWSDHDSRPTRERSQPENPRCQGHFSCPAADSVENYKVSLELPVQISSDVFPPQKVTH